MTKNGIVLLLICILVPCCYGNDSEKLPKPKFRSFKSILEDALNSFQIFLDLNFMKEEDLLVDLLTSGEDQNDRFFWVDSRSPDHKISVANKQIWKKTKFGGKINIPKLSRAFRNNSTHHPGHSTRSKAASKPPPSRNSTNPRYRKHGRTVKKGGVRYVVNKFRGYNEPATKDGRRKTKLSDIIDPWKIFDVIWTSALVMAFVCGVIFVFRRIKRRKKKITLYTNCKLKCPEKGGPEIQHSSSEYCKTEQSQPLGYEDRQKASESSVGALSSIKISKTNAVPLSVYI